MLVLSWFNDFTLGLVDVVFLLIGGIHCRLENNFYYGMPFLNFLHQRHKSPYFLRVSVVRLPCGPLPVHWTTLLEIEFIFGR